ncbi:ATP-binding protein [Nocardia sp. NPDC048505]|uniref:sensor histidine kinase n=1 Tax=unclassified Nocardia TaxID=2637762 RepID=UPI0033EE94D2
MLGELSNAGTVVERGIVEAIRALALDSPVDVRVDAPDQMNLTLPVGAAIYFAVAELLANVAKTAPAASVIVRLRKRTNGVEVEVEDNGPGGAKIVPGGGLDGIRQRLASFDGTLALTSPVGGPTKFRLEVPCALL